MKIIVDSNIVFSAMLNPASSIGDIILNSQDTFTFYTCEYLREEINDHKDKIVTIAGYDTYEFDEVTFLVYQHVVFLSESTIPFEFWQKAAGLVRDIDMDDIAYVALSLYLGIQLWTGDKLLIAGLAKKGFTNFITTQDMLQLRRVI